MGIDTTSTENVLDPTETALEFQIRLIESKRRMHARLATKIHTGEEQVTKLILELIV